MGNTIVVNYHYIRDESTNGIHACSIDLFKKQVHFLKKNYTIVPLTDIYRAAVENTARPVCALTFDDGLTEHYEVAFRVLKENGVMGTFFVIGAPLEAKTVPVTHKLHLLLTHKSTPELVELFHSFFKRHYVISDTERINPKRRFDDVLTSNLKEALIALPVTKKDAFIESVFTDIYKNESEISKKTFMSSDHLLEMHKNGMEIGSHTYSHQALDGRDYDEQEADIKKGVRVIHAITGKDVSTFSYPHGRHTADTLEILKKMNFSVAVVLGGRSVTSQDHRFSIPRYDTNDIKL